MSASQEQIRDATRELAKAIAIEPRTLKEAGLVYVSDEEPGFRRRKSGKHFIFFDTDGKRVRDEKTVARIRRLAIPPAYTDVWICRRDNGHLQATGRDARGRKQYRYHAGWRMVRDAAKYERLADFADTLPALRRAVNADLKLDGLPRQKVLAAVVRLLQRSLIRVGNEEYSRANGSYGLTTLRNRHVQVRGKHIEFSFRGKSGKFHAIELDDERLARVVRNCQELPGQKLFGFRNDEGGVEEIDSNDVNEYIRTIAGEEFSAKYFRTWAGTLLAARALSAVEKAATKAEEKQVIAAAITEVAQRLGNTPTVCRSCYVHPAVLETYAEGMLKFPPPLPPSKRPKTALSAEEKALRRLIRKHAKWRRR
ncbi:MAG TPA: DNA topoisomerase IB [Rudaea sp.]|jgi:DNA topoisomerase-1|nr:DNA topoisomerase IB [Rudaea sp.]